LVEAALHAAFERGVALPEAVYSQFPALSAILERALAREDFAEVHTVRPATALARRLPVGMCERLLSVPLQVDGRSGRLDVAVVDVLDEHIPQEFSFHLKMPVRVLRARFDEVMAALDGLHTSGTFLPGLSRMLRGEGANVGSDEFNVEDRIQGDAEVRNLPSDPPIPLVRKSIVPRAPRAEDSSPLDVKQPSTPPVPPAAAEQPSERPSEPILSLRRPKPDASALVATWTRDLPSALAEIDASETAEQVLQAVAAALEPLKAVILALRGASFVGRVGSAALGKDADVRSLAVRASGVSALDRAVEAGFYLGGLPFMEAHERLARMLAVSGPAEVYARTVLVSERPSSVIVVAGFRESTEASRRVDELARAAGVALERIVLRRKRG
jgi:hypothetical protein